MPVKEGSLNGEARKRRQKYGQSLTTCNSTHNHSSTLHFSVLPTPQTNPQHHSTLPTLNRPPINHHKLPLNFIKCSAQPHQHTQHHQKHTPPPPLTPAVSPVATHHQPCHAFITTRRDYQANPYISESRGARKRPQQQN